MIHPRLSINALSSVTWSFEQDLQLWRELGVHHAGVLLPKLGPDIRQKLQQLTEAKIQPTTIVGGGFNLADPHSWHDSRASLMNLIDIVADLEGTTSIYFPPGRSTGQSWDQVLKLFSDAVSPCVDYAARKKVPLAIEPSLRTAASFVNTLRDAIDVAETTGMGIVVDIGNCWMERDLQSTLMRAAPHITLIQVGDVRFDDTNGPQSGERVHIGDGELRIDQLLGWILDTGYAGLFDLEVLGQSIEREGYQSAVSRGARQAGEWLSKAGL